MGYRLEVSKIEHRYCGGKLYSYFDNYKDFESFKWLVDKGFIDEEDEFNYFFNPHIVMNKEEFSEFITLYEKDFEKAWDIKEEFIDISDYKTKKKLELEELKNEDGYKLLEWY